MSIKKHHVVVIVIAILVTFWVAFTTLSVDVPLTEIELCQLQTLMSNRAALDQVLSQNGYSKGEGNSPTYYKMEGNGEHSILVNVKLDKQFWYNEDACYFDSDRSGATGIEWGHTFIVSYAGVEVFMRELSSNKHATLIDEELHLLLTAIPDP